MNKAMKKHYSDIAEVGCALCRFVLNIKGTPAEVHHIRRAGKRNDAPVIPLCPMHHRFQYGIHHMGRKAWEKHFNTTEEELLGKTLEIINGND
jgi:hypothetical protein